MNLTLELGNRRETMVLDLDPSLPNEATIITELQAGHLYEPDVSLAMIRILRPGDVFVDVGVNAGFFSILGARLVGATGRVLGLEPDPRSLARLPGRLAANNLGNVTILPVAASDRAGDITFHLNMDDSGGSALWDPGRFPGNTASRQNPSNLTVPAVRLDAMLAAQGSGPPRLIKIDTEGADHAVLLGATGVLTGRRVPFVITELHEFGLRQMGSSQADLRRMMAALGYEAFLLSHDGSLPKWLPAGTALRSQYIRNLLFTTGELLSTIWPEEAPNLIV